MDKIKKPEKQVSITFTRKFIYSKASLSNDGEAYNYAHRDMMELLSGINLKDENLNFSNSFKVDFKNEPLFKFRKVIPENDERMVSFYDLIRKLTTRTIEDKYKESLEPTSKSKLFVFDPPVYAEDGKTVLHEGEWYLHPDIEEDFLNTERQFIKLLG